MSKPLSTVDEILQDINGETLLRPLVDPNGHKWADETYVVINKESLISAKAQLRSLVEKFAEELIGEDNIQKRDDEEFDEWLVCSTCDCILSDETEPEYGCQCTTRNALRSEQRENAPKLLEQMFGGGDE
mgnify:CR=1 FL=1